MHRRQRDIQRMVADLGMEITSFRQDGSSHWKVDVKAPNGRQRPFIFSTRTSGHHMRDNEEATLRRWRREVMPELEDTEELPTPDSMKGPLAIALEDAKLGIKAARPPFAVKKVPLSVVPPPSQPAKEIVVSQPPATSHTVNGHTGHDLATERKKREAMSFNEVMKFGAWMSAERLAGVYVKTEFLEMATKELGFSVSRDALDAWLENNGVEMPQRPLTVKLHGEKKVIRNQDRIEAVARELAAFMQKMGEPVPERLMDVIRHRAVRADGE